MDSVRRAYDSVQQAWSGQRWESWAETCAEGYRFDTGTGLRLDLAGTMAWSRAWFAAFPDYTEEIGAVHIGPVHAGSPGAGSENAGTGSGGTGTGVTDSGDDRPVGAKSVVAELIGEATSVNDFVLGGATLLPATGRRFRIAYAKVLVFDGDLRVVRDRQYQDRLDLYRQLGVPAAFGD
ncbi:hypothetical protein [Nocardia sp. BMG51109]|uniref:hypothetical protein n=1 Tax=Nocardia sp. BMG51109 TaxID=1056816 RepID=UPI0004639ECF|nr:hypothetical protein [Nocardia sp. BMG51109]